MAVNIPGIVAVVFFYVSTLVIGIIAGRKTSKSSSAAAVLVADRSLGLVVSLFTLTATMVGGGYVNGTAEAAARSGLLQTQAPFGFCFALWIAAICYVPKMRREGYITMFDPFQLKYGKKVGALLFVPQLLGDLFWSAAVLAALGATISIILDLNSTLSILVSASVAIIYTFLGGLYSVAYTDVVQLAFIAGGLVLAFPFALTSSAVDLSRISSTWEGEIPVDTIAIYVDLMFMMVLGGIPWQALFQRVLACRTVKVASWATFLSSFLSFGLAIPPFIMGVAGSAADWNHTHYDGPLPLPDDMKSFILPLALSYLTPAPVAIVGIGAIAAAAMSSSDSCILSTSSVITKNIYHDIFRPQASEKELRWALRINILFAGVLGTLIAIFATTIYGLFVLCSDLMYVVLFPQLTLVLWMDKSNSYGCLVGFFVSLVLRMLAGEPVLKFPYVIKYPFFDEDTKTQRFPFRTFSMLVGSLCIIGVSLLSDFLFSRGILPLKYDVLKCQEHRTIKMRENRIRSTLEDGDEAQAMPLTSTKEPIPS